MIRVEGLHSSYGALDCNEPSPCLIIGASSVFSLSLLAWSTSRISHSWYEDLVMTHMLGKPLSLYPCHLCVRCDTLHFLFYETFVFSYHTHNNPQTWQDSPFVPALFYFLVIKEFCEGRFFFFFLRNNWENLFTHSVLWFLMHAFHKNIVR